MGIGIILEIWNSECESLTITNCLASILSIYAVTVLSNQVLDHTMNFRNAWHRKFHVFQKENET